MNPRYRHPNSTSASRATRAIRLALQVALAGALALTVPSRGDADSNAIAVIAHKSVATSSLGRSELRPIFQTKQSSWPDGSSVTPLNLPGANSLRQGFDAAVLGLDPSRVARYWVDRKIRGGTRAPKNVPSPELVLKVVSKKPGAVGYIAASRVDSSVKVIARIINGQVKKP